MSESSPSRRRHRKDYARNTHPIDLVEIRSSGDAHHSFEESDEKPPEEHNVEDDIRKSYVLIREATSLTDFGKLHDARSIESKVARSRGTSEIVNNGDVGESDDNTVSIKFDEGKLKVDTGYVMSFVSEKFTHLPIYDILSIPDIPSYPVSKRTLESLPSWVCADLDRDGHVKCTGVYDQSTKEFYSVKSGWENRPENLADIFVNILDEFGGDKLAQPVYYYINKFASDEYSDFEAIAELRGIQTSSVESEVKEAIEQLESGE